MAEHDISSNFSKISIETMITTTKGHHNFDRPQQMVGNDRAALDLWRSTKVVDLYPVLVVDILYMLFGIVGNSVVCYICFFRMPRSVINTFVLSLAVLELLGCIFTIPVDMTEIISVFAFNFPILCKTERYFRKMIIFSTGCILVAIAAERYKRIVKPYERHVTLTQVRWTILWALVVSLLCAIPEAVLAGTQTIQTPDGDAVVCSTYHSDVYRHTIYPKLWGFIVVLLYIFSIASIGITYFVIASRIWKRGKVQTDRRSKPNTPDSTLQRRVRSRSHQKSKSAELSGSASDILAHHQYFLNRLHSFSQYQKKDSTLNSSCLQEQQSDLFLRRQKRNGVVKSENYIHVDHNQDNNSTSQYLEVPSSTPDQSSSNNQEPCSPLSDDTVSESAPCIAVDKGEKCPQTQDKECILYGSTPEDHENMQVIGDPEPSSVVSDATSVFTESPVSTHINNDECGVLPDYKTEEAAEGEKNLCPEDTLRTARHLSNSSQASCESERSHQGDSRPTVLFAELIQSLNQNGVVPRSPRNHADNHLSADTCPALQPLPLTPVGSFRRKAGRAGYSRKRTTFIMFVMTLTTALSHLPHIVVLLYSLSRPGVEAFLSQDMLVVFRVAWNSFFISLATHPFVYGFWNGRFKHALHVLWTGLRRGRHRIERESCTVEF